MDADPRLDAVWRVAECTDEYRENCACMIVTGEGDRIQYVADAETPELAARIVADHDEVVALREQLAKLETAAVCPSAARAYESRCVLPIRHHGDHRNAERNHCWDDSHALPITAVAEDKAAIG
jgi:hypothetical protein